MIYPIVLYHGVSSDSLPYYFHNVYECEWVISLNTFVKHLNIIKELNFNVVTLNDIRMAKNNKSILEKPIVLTFDDGHETNYFNVFPLLVKYGFTAEFFITSDWIDTPGYMTRQQLCEMSKAGMSIQSHARSHVFLNTVDALTLQKEILDSKHCIASIIGKSVDYISYPGGKYSLMSEECVAHAGYLGSLTSDRGYNQLNGSMFALKRQGITKYTTDHVFKAQITNNLLYYTILEIKILLLKSMRMLFTILKRR